MNKKIVIFSLLMALLVSLTSIPPALASKNTDVIALKNDLVTIEVNRYLGKTPEQIHTTVTAAEAEQIKQDLIALYDAQQRNDQSAISKYESLLKEKGIFVNSNQKFYSNDNGVALMEKTKLLRFPSSLAGENISNRICYFNAIGEGAMLWWLGLAFAQAIVKAVENVSNPIGAIILLIILLPLLVLTMLLTDLIPFRIFAPTGAISVQNGTISCLGLNGFQRVKVGAEAYGVNLSGFTGITINIPPINNHKSFLFVSGFALKAEGLWT
jgi:hypothetical protein